MKAEYIPYKPANLFTVKCAKCGLVLSENGQPVPDDCFFPLPLAWRGRNGLLYCKAHVKEGRA